MPSKTTAKPATPRTQSKLKFTPSSAGKSADAKATSNAKRSGKPANGNILNFFKKVQFEDQLFCGPPSVSDALPPTVAPNKREEVEEDIYGFEEDAEKSRYNEHQSVSKRRKLSHDGDQALIQTTRSEVVEIETSVTIGAPKPTKLKSTRGKVPFLEDSDSEDDNTSIRSTKDISRDSLPDIRIPDVKPATSRDKELPEEDVPVTHVPSIKQEDSVYDNFEDLEDIEGLFDDDEFDGGEEFHERRYMEEQARIEAEEAGTYISDCALDDRPTQTDAITESCPLCNVSLAGITPEQASLHVNACLDGKPIPLPTQTKPPSSTTVDAPEVSKRFARATVPRPGQANPISLGSTRDKPTSAFTKLMSGHAEDAAWASAAAAENASRGKPAYQRTCPFYKIMPGFFICVDAFRYGAVKGCNAYFLSHFHSDHYIGLTANWSHGPIYCSEVTGSLIKSQLRTEAKWVVPLEFEAKVEIPGTEGVTVTMLPANHCPGSSLFLFEKTLGKGPTPRTQRILHCGDFRACPAQVTHPLLRPETIDSISGKVKQQKIDICYLDTTYLNPRYSFPPQEDVIKACAEFCKSISGDPSAAEEAFKSLKREKGSTSMSKFFSKETCNNDKGSSAKPNPGEPVQGAEPKKNRLLVVCGTYSIGKERICKAIALALGTKIFASPAKERIVRQLGDPELAALLTSDPREAQVHMQALAEIRAETLQEYLDTQKPHFTRIVGFRPSGWNFRSSSSSSSSSSSAGANVAPSAVPTTAILHGPGWRPRFAVSDLAAQRGSTPDAMCFGVPYSEHSSFRELALFLMTLRVDRVVPTVNVGSEASRRRMKGWIDRWLAERRRGGFVKVLVEDGSGGDGSGGDKGKGKGQEKDPALWDGKDGKGGCVWW
ncbi:hypothetical protein DL767_009086 [Monosporascus sp. MG133]|nr:hypothetical protein DL767_009086 [Monosporascus sp. MG133]